MIGKEERIKNGNNEGMKQKLRKIDGNIKEGKKEMYERKKFK